MFQKNLQECARMCPMGSLPFDVLLLDYFGKGLNETDQIVFRCGHHFTKL